MAAALIAGAASAAGPLILKALENEEPELAKLLSSLPSAMVPVAPATPALNVETSAAAQLLKDLPDSGNSEYTKIKAQIGESIAIYVTDHGAKDLLSGGKDQVAWLDIVARVVAAVTAGGIIASDISPLLLWQMILSGILMYVNGLGTKALAVEK
jgi:hypothetical protein